MPKLTPRNSRFSPCDRRDSQPTLFLVVDTEEEFDWNKPHSRSEISVKAMRGIHHFQEICEHVGVKPVYAVGYPVASQEASVTALRDYIVSGRAYLAAHLHPWVSPPHSEEVSSYNSYPCNLPPELERRKIERLLETLERAFGVRPQSYKAGRYGISMQSVSALNNLGVKVDFSPCPPYDYTADGGPDFSDWPHAPFWYDAQGSLLAVPTTGAYIGWGSFLAKRLFPYANSSLGQRLHIPGILARTRTIDRLRLTPEICTLDENIRLTKVLYRRGVRVFNFAFHSPSLAIGHTPYVRNERELADLLTSIQRYLEWFITELHGTTIDPLEFHQQMS